jgi:hypothetical protein
MPNKYELNDDERLFHQDLTSDLSLLEAFAPIDDADLSKEAAALLNEKEAAFEGAANISQFIDEDTIERGFAMGLKETSVDWLPTAIAMGLGLG